MTTDARSGRTKRTVAVVHGWGSTPARTWPEDGLAGDLRRSGLNVVAPTLPGHGSGASTCSDDYADIDRQLRALLPRTYIDGSGDAVGFSLGGKLLLRLVSCGALRVRRLAVLGVGANLFTGEAGDAVTRALADGPPDGAGPGFREVISEARASEINQDALGAVIRRPPRLVEPPDLAAVTCDVLIIVGEDDDIAGDPAPLAQALPSATVVRVPGLGHSTTPHDHRVRQLVSEFLLREE
ncbi:alpha/beta hydrolase [Nocardioides sp. NBC_00163]|uniref:alpha/beta fold hydrolase n=1 Tax=Nocardioides sp. NBC_00163 TaxID=2975999 RepID=UPI0032475D22